MNRNIFVFFLAPILGAWGVGSSLIEKTGGSRVRVIRDLGRGVFAKVVEVVPEWRSEQSDHLALKVYWRAGEAMARRYQRLGIIGNDWSEKHLLRVLRFARLTDSDRPSEAVVGLFSTLMHDSFENTGLNIFSSKGMKNPAVLKWQLRLINILIRDGSDFLTELHQRKLVHGDIKPSNIFLAAPMSKILAGESGFVLGDFDGMIKVGDVLDYYSSAYAAPEYFVNKGRRLNHAADRYSFGCTLYAKLFGESPLLTFLRSNEGTRLQSTPTLVLTDESHYAEMIEHVRLKFEATSRWPLGTDELLNLEFLKELVLAALNRDPETRVIEFRDLISSGMVEEFLRAT